VASANPLRFDHPPLTPEQQAELDDAMADVRAGFGIPGEVVTAQIEARHAQAEALSATLRARGIDPAPVWEGADEAQAFCDLHFGTGAERVMIRGSFADEAWQAECRAYEARTGKKIRPGPVPLTPEQRVDFNAVMEITAGHPEGIPGELVTAQVQARGAFEAKHGSAAWLRGLGMAEDEVQKTLAEWAEEEAAEG
jgi:hypothetical protein